MLGNFNGLRSESFPRLMKKALQTVYVLNRNNLNIRYLAQLRAKYKMVNRAEKVKEPVEGILISGKSGQNWNDVIEKYIIVDSEDGGSFVIRRQYFLEAAEGHGTRFEYMLREFRIGPKA